MSVVHVHLKERAYPILIGGDRFRRLGRFARSMGLGPAGVVVTNRTTRRLVGPAVLRALRAAGWRVAVIEVPDTERAKSPAIALRAIRQIARRSRRELPTLFAVGGGVVGDVTGFIASAFRRGVPYVQVPTTLLAQVDSAIGGKVGIDLPEGKNLVGAYYQPRAVYSDVTVLQTLPPRQLRAGLSEVIKYAAIADTELWARLERRREALLCAHVADLRWVVHRCSRIKARVVAQDERETHGTRTLLNFGHTVGHAVEAATEYSGRVTHGEAIAIGMAVAADVGVALGITPSAIAAQLLALLRGYGLPTMAPDIRAARVEQMIAYDKKFVGRAQRWVLLRRLGHAVVVRGVAPAVVSRMLRRRIGGRSHA